MKWRCDVLEEYEIKPKMFFIECGLMKFRKGYLFEVFKNHYCDGKYWYVLNDNGEMQLLGMCSLDGTRGVDVIDEFRADYSGDHKKQ